MKLATVLTPPSDENLQLAAQCGVTDIVHRYPGPDAQVLKQTKDRFATFGLQLSVVEGYLPIENIKLGIDDGTEIAAMKLLIRQMAEFDIRLLCYNFMCGTDWCRTRLDAPARGGAKVTAFDIADVEKAIRLGYQAPNADSDALARRLTPEQLWGQLERMLNELLPVAEECGVVLAMHPDDPPLPELLGKPRIMHNVAGFDRLLAMASSTSNAVCFCQGTFATMNVDIPATIRHFGRHIQYVHFRDVEGRPGSFVETFHDNGPTDMAAAMRAYCEIGFTGPIRPDHVPQLVGEDDGDPGYTMLGRLFAFGYMRGLMQAAKNHM
ncbi:MAG: mannonate dehydratase [Planctomycetota bacterium]|nr:mannonate dehydratase [Planctomycetota bacterium]